MKSPLGASPFAPEGDVWQSRFERERAARKEAERLLTVKTRELFAANEALRAQAAEVRASYAQLEDAQTALLEQSKTSVLGALAASIAHEVATPLGVAVTGATHAEGLLVELRGLLGQTGADDEAAQELMADLVEALRLVVVNVRRADAQVRATRQVAVDQVSGRLRVAEVVPLLREAIETMRPTLRRARVTVAVEGPDALLVEVAAGALSQVLINLVQNACVHAFGDEHADRRVRIEIEDAGDRLVVRCRDNGRGMSEAVAARVFEPFFTTRPNEGGSGLGMAIVHDLVKDVFGGSAALWTLPGTGTEWRIELPVGADTLRRR